jgi:hypothetical protein
VNDPLIHLREILMRNPDDDDRYTVVLELAFNTARILTIDPWNPGKPVSGRMEQTFDWCQVVGEGKSFLTDNFDLPERGDENRGFQCSGCGCCWQVFAAGNELLSSGH